MFRSTMNVIRLGVDLAVAQLVRDASDGDEVAAAEQGDRVVVGDALAVERLVEDLRSTAGVATVALTA